ncbi:hypothetical protein [Sporosarcina sp. FSL K6-1508]|uniref:hypothetical protein n=1 Tax=Sporosarcina sp. FSL K6-1508 TaxID=2921553 RepID=UPI0030F836EF
MILGGKQTNGWYAAGSGLLKCPVPDCGHAAPIITKVHCRTHGMEREEIKEKFGLPKKVVARHPFKGEK